MLFSDSDTDTPSAPSSKTVFNAVVLGVVAGLATMFALIMYSFEAGTEPERGWEPVSVGWIVASPFIISPLVCLGYMGIAFLRMSRRLRLAHKPQQRTGRRRPVAERPIR